MEHKSQDWHRADIKSALEKRGITLRELSRSAGLSPDSLRNVFTRNWPRAEQIIAQALELNFSSSSLKLITAIIVALAMSYPAICDSIQKK